MPSKAPTIEFEWELAVFRGLRSLWQTLRKAERGRRAPGLHAVHADERERHYALLVQLGAGGPVKVTLTSCDGGVCGRSVALPKTVDLFDDREVNERHLVLRSLLAGAIVATDDASEGGGDPVGRARFECLRVEVAVEHLTGHFPLFETTWADACAAVLRTRAPLHPRSQRGELAIESLRRGLLEKFARGAVPAGPEVRQEPVRVSLPVPLWGLIVAAAARGPLHGATLPEGESPSKGITSEAEAPKLGDVRAVTIDPKELADAVLQHTFEKIATADAHHGGARDLDGTDELDDHLEALGEVPLGAVTRTLEGASSLLWANLDLETKVPDVASVAPGEHGIAYDEWDARANLYRRDFCTVYPTAWPRRDDPLARAALRAHRTLVQRVEEEVLIHRARRAPQKRQTDGETIDIDAMVRHLAAVRAGHAGPPRPYIRRVRTDHELGTTVLIDMSLSSDAWVENRRVLDVAREAALVLGEVADRLGDEIQVLGFASHTRNRCRVFTLRDWGEPWSVGRARIGSIEPQGFTRIGPALRHATREVSRSGARRRMVLLLTDGRPTDYDRYEGAHGVADVRQAVREAKRAGVWVHGLTLDTRARETFSAMLGGGRWEVLRHVSALPLALAKVWLQASRA